MHKDYPELVKTALAADAYWRMPEGELLNEDFLGSTGGTIEGLNALRDEQNLMGNGEAAHHIGSLVTSVEESSIVEELAWGEPIPELHKRQFVVAVEDSREIEHKADPASMAKRAIEAIYIRKAKKLVAKIGNGEVIDPTFEEQLEAFYSPEGLLQTPARTRVNYGLTHVASIQRSLFFMRKDERSGFFLAMPAIAALLPPSWSRPNLQVIPDRPIGSVYSKKFIGGPGRFNHLGKITSAKIVDVQNVHWKNKNNGRPKRKKVSSESARLKEKLALEIS